MLMQVLSFYDLEAKGSSKGGTQGEHLSFERKLSFAVKQHEVHL